MTVSVTETAAITAPSPVMPLWAAQAVNLADPRLGALALTASDEFFAPLERMLAAAQPVFIPGKYDAHGKWMDGWETRRRRGPGHDSCVVRLARPGRIRGLLVDTSFFTGNYPPAFSLEACLTEAQTPDESAVWQTLAAAQPLEGNAHRFVEVSDGGVWSHVRLNIYPDGGVARLRVYGEPVPLWREGDGDIDLAAAVNGGRAVVWNDAHFGQPGNLILPGRGTDMGDGWETRRRREPGHDWCILKLGLPGTLRRIEVDTAHFRGNYPDMASLQGVYAPDANDASLPAQSMFWPELLSPQKLAADSVHVFEPGPAGAPVTHVRFNIHPDGGVSRLRLLGTPSLADSVGKEQA